MSSKANRTMERSVTTLLVRHLPKELTNQEKIDFLCHFGADRVRPMGTKGRMKHTAFAQFDNPATAENSIKRIHQLEILGCKLVVEYARLSDQNNFPSELESKKLKLDDYKSDVQPTEVPKEVNNIDAVKDETFKKYGIQYPRKPNLHYLYPPPSVSTLTNIANALASHPRFYVQVLHLMNKMNIPAPFGVVTPTPPLASDTRRLERSDTADLENSSGHIEEVEMEYTSTEESEISDDEASRNIQRAKEILPQRKVCFIYLTQLMFLNFEHFFSFCSKYSRTSMAQTLMAHSPGLARTIMIRVPTCHSMHYSPWMSGTTLG